MFFVSKSLVRNLSLFLLVRKMCSTMSNKDDYRKTVLFAQKNKRYYIINDNQIQHPIALVGRQHNFNSSHGGLTKKMVNTIISHEIR